MAVYGASDPLPSVPATVGLPNQLPSFDLGGANWSKCQEADIPAGRWRTLSGRLTYTPRIIMETVMIII